MGRLITFSSAINEALHQEMEKDSSVFIIGEDVAKMGGDFGVTRGIWEKWPERAKDTALSEAAIVGTCCGAAIAGLRPVAEMMFADFIGVAFDQVVNNASKIEYMFEGRAHGQLVIRAVTGAGIRCAYHHSHSIESWFMHAPGIVIVAPSTPYEAKGLLIASIRNNNPIIFLEHKGLYNVKGEVPEESYEIPLYQASVEKIGTDLTLICTMNTYYMALEAATDLDKEGVSVEVINLRTIVPYDKETILNSVSKTGRLVIAQEGPHTLGFAAELSAFVTEEIFEYLRAPVMRVTSLDTSIPFSPKMEDYVLPNKKRIFRACVDLLNF